MTVTDPLGSAVHDLDITAVSVAQTRQDNRCRSRHCTRLEPRAHSLRLLVHEDIRLGDARSARLDPFLRPDV